MKLTQEQREAIFAFADSDGWPALKVILESLVTEKRRRVISYPLTQGPEGLVHEKARAEGAESLQAALIAEVERTASKERKI